jgi:predicted O-linked N-acetylglucosamine transferase (SPINDLY family)
MSTLDRLNWNSDNYHQIAVLYEEAITENPDRISNYWYLGLAYLLQGEEAEAQTTWLLGMSQLDEEEINDVTIELIDILTTEADKQNDEQNFHQSWLIRQHIRELNPDNVNNLLILTLLSFELNCFSFENFKEWEIIEKLSDSNNETINFQLLVNVLDRILFIADSTTLLFLKICFNYTQDKNDFINFIIKTALRVAYQKHYQEFAAQILEVCLEYNPTNLGILLQLSCLYSNYRNYSQGIVTARKFRENAQTLFHQLIGTYVLLRAFLTASYWQEVEDIILEQKNIVSKLIVEKITTSNKVDNTASLTSLYFLPYIKDDIKENLWYRNQIGQIFQESLRNIVKDKGVFHLNYSCSLIVNRKLKIGYVASTLRNHSVGWLSRWLFHYHDRANFEINLYLINQDPEDPFMQAFFRDKVDVTYTFPNESETIAKQIREDEVDILVDLDSMTYDITCEVMALKPSPIQATWLGWDTSGVPAIDYYIADPYVLADNAQQYYSETIWRLPQTYVAVDGFEVGTPTLKRSDLDIPDDAVTFFSAQVGYKRHPDTIRLQLQIIKEVPNSYFLIKGIGDKGIIQDYFGKLADEVGIDADRLRFLERDKDEFTHRANLAIADIVLDTYPYNGATTTLETLWMGIPIVTRVGEQFAARNTYTFMKNAGIEEGIAWTDEEYVEWGVRLGKNQSLRWEIAGKLRASRQTSPLWNAKKFTQEMENAYRQMWAKYVGN